MLCNSLLSRLLQTTERWKIVRWEQFFLSFFLFISFIFSPNKYWFWFTCLCACEVIFLWDQIPLMSSSCDVVFLWCRITWMLSSCEGSQKFCLAIIWLFFRLTNKTRAILNSQKKVIQAPWKPWNSKTRCGQSIVGHPVIVIKAIFHFQIVFSYNGREKCYLKVTNTNNHWK